MAEQQVAITASGHQRMSPVATSPVACQTLRPLCPDTSKTKAPALLWRNSPITIAPPVTITPQATAPSADTRPRREKAQEEMRRGWPQRVLSAWGDTEVWGDHVPGRQLLADSGAFPGWEEQAVLVVAPQWQRQCHAVLLSERLG